MSSPPIAAHRLLGDGRSTALLRPGGEVDWWCAPSLDDPPLLWSLLDAGGAAARWCGVRSSSAPGPPAATSHTTVLRAPTGRVQCRDAVHCREGRPSALVRLVRGLDADLDLEHELALGGFDQPWATWDGATARLADRVVRVEGGTSTADGRWLRTRVTAPHGAWAAVLVTLDPGRDAAPDVLLRELDAAQAAEQQRLSAASLPRHMPHRALDALRVLSLCTFADTGAVAAAVTTSLPEAVGADRQFDYRFSWLRDASLAVSVAALLGRPDVAEDYLRFVVRQAGPGRLPEGPMTDVRGDGVPQEREVQGVAGWGGSLPVRVGNDARDQLQYDALGLLVEAVSVHVQAGGRLQGEVWDVVRAVADRVAAADLDEPTSGIWELREPKRLVSADIGRWLALDRAIWIARGWRPWTRRRHWVRARRAARDRVLAALQPDGGLPQSYDDPAGGPGGDTADASALMAVVFRLLDRRDPRAGALVDATLRRLDAAPYLYRYEPGGDDGFAGTEGAFLPASWWVVSALAACGRVEEAERRAVALDRATPSLQPEEMDPESGQGLGNTPLVWSHMEAARAMYLLDSASRRDAHGLAGLGLWRLGRYLASR